MTMTIDQELLKISKKLHAAKDKARTAFTKMEQDTELSCGKIKKEYQALMAGIEKSISTATGEIDSYFSSDEFLKVDIDTSQFDSDIRHELKNYSHYSPVDGCDVVRFNAIKWNYKKAAAVLRQDPEKHASITPVAKLDKWKLQEIVLNGAGDKCSNLLASLKDHQDALNNVEQIISDFDEHNEFYGIIL